MNPQISRRTVLRAAPAAGLAGILSGCASTTAPAGQATSLYRVDDEATERGADALAVVLGDLPLLTSDALSAALRTVGPVVLARSKDGAGTNLLLRRPPRAIRPRFGTNSFAAHREEAAGKGLPVAVVDAPELAFDLDAPDDILSLLERSGTGRTLAVCTELELGPRLRVGT